MGPLGDDCVHRMGAGACKRRGSRVRPGRCVCVCVCPCVRARVRACVGMVITHQHHLLQHLRRNTTPSPDGRPLSDLAFLWPASQVSCSRGVACHSKPPIPPYHVYGISSWGIQVFGQVFGSRLGPEAIYYYYCARLRLLFKMGRTLDWTSSSS